jgi:hypothetical protein
MQAGFLFSAFPKIYYSFDGGITPVVVTDITKRFEIVDLVRDYATIYYTHYIQDGQRPDVVSNIYYQNSALDWIILMTNQILDPFYQWPLDYASFQRYIKSKYGSIPNAQQQIFQYQQIIQPSSQLVDGTIVPQRVVIVDETCYNSIIDEDSRAIVTAYQYEQQLNDARKTIKVIHESFVPQILSSVSDIFSS